METGSVYALYDLRSPGVYRYVGQTVRTLRARLWEHRHLVKTSSRIYVARWIRKVGPLNVQIELLGAYPTDVLDFQECFWIAALREAGHALTNIAPGGKTGGFPKGYFHHTPESRAKISQAQLGGKRRADTRARMSEAAKKRVYTEEDRAKLRGRKFTDEHRAKLRAAWVRRRRAVQKDPDLIQ